MFNQLISFRHKSCKLLAVLCCISWDVSAVDVRKEAYFKVDISSSKGAEIQLESRMASLVEVLGHLAKKTKTPIHYSALPEELVTATCVGPTLKPVLECLFAGKAVLTYREADKKTTEDAAIAEVWVMGSSLAGKQASEGNCQARAERAERELAEAQQKLQEKDGGDDMTDEFLKMSESGKPQARAAAIGGLLTSKRRDDPAVKAVLEKALSDESATVRAQAISTMAQLNGNEATSILQDALQDESVDVRLMAVSSIDDNINLLRQAANDSDETVRTLATIKLKELESKKKH